MNLLKVCAAVDAQLLVEKNQYHIFEVSVVAKYYKRTKLCKPDLDFQTMAYKDFKTNKHIMNNLLGISWPNEKEDYKPMITDDGEQMLVNMYNEVKTKQQQYVAIKNQQLGVILEKWGIPYINVENLECPSYGKLKEEYGANYCHNHDKVRHTLKIRCAEQKAVCIWKFINECIEKDKKLFI